MAEGESRPLADRLAALLGQASGRWHQELRDRRGSLERRKADLSALATRPARLDELRRQAEELETDAAALRQELASAVQAREELSRREEELEAGLQAAHDRLRARCIDLASRLPLLTGSSAAGWVSWLEAWHQQLGRAFEPTADWQGYLSSRRAVNNALDQFEPVFQQIHELDVASGETGISRSELPAEIAREEARVRELEADFVTRSRQVGTRYGRILEDLPEPADGNSVAQLEQIADLLANLEATLGRFAASALLERQMLEALQ